MNTFFRCLESRIDKNNTLYGKFSLNSILSGQGNTFANSLRRSLFSDLSGLAITHFCITSKPGLNYEFATLPGLAESVLDFSLNLKKVVLTGRVIDYEMQEKKLLPSFSATTSLPSLCAIRPKVTARQNLVKQPTFGRDVKQPSALKDPRLHNNVTFRNAQKSFLVQSKVKTGLLDANLRSSEAKPIDLRCAVRPKVSTNLRMRSKSFFTSSQTKINFLGTKTSFARSSSKTKKQLRAKLETRSLPSVVPHNRIYERGLWNKYDKSSFSNHYYDNQLLTRSKACPTSEARDAKLTFGRTAQKLSSALPVAPVGFLKVKGPAILRAKDLILPAGIRCVHPNQYLGTLAADGALSIKFLVAAGKGFIVQDEILYNSLSRAKLLFSLNDTEAYNPSSNYLGLQNEVSSGFYASSPKPAATRGEALATAGSHPTFGQASSLTSVKGLDYFRLQSKKHKTKTQNKTKKHQDSATSTFSDKLKNLPISAFQNRSYIGESSRINKILDTPFAVRKDSKKSVTSEARDAKLTFGRTAQVALSNSYEATSGQAELPLVLRSMQNITFRDYERSSSQRRTKTKNSSAVRPKVSFASPKVEQATKLIFESTFDQIQSSKVSSQNHNVNSINKTLFLPTIKNQKSKKTYYQAKAKQSCGSKQNFLPYKGFTIATLGSTLQPKVIAEGESKEALAFHPKVRGTAVVTENTGKLHFSERKEANLASLSKSYGQNSSKKLAKKQLTWSAEESSYPVLPLDVTFTPVSKVNFQVNVNRNSEKNEETIIFEIWTNGSITPKRAIQESCLALAQDFYNLFCHVNELSSLQLWWKRESIESKITRAALPLETYRLGVRRVPQNQEVGLDSTLRPRVVSSFFMSEALTNPRFVDAQRRTKTEGSKLLTSDAILTFHRASLLVAESEAKKFKDQINNRKLHSQVKKCIKVYFPESKNLRLKQKVHYLHAFWRLNISDLNLSLETQLLLKKLNINSVYDLHFFILKKSWSLFLNSHQQKEIVKIYLNFGLNSPF